ncbi:MULTISPECIES: TetR/AcrR family transcriptional regulator [Amycolatopsis]|uniref:TetR family transcriptional regulator n=2 Tax=Amycolatopsis methanolica group TaxID=2893674 RepID=A0A076MMP0_AMYME|nr:MULTISPECIES: TetR/AcrR family transcriptional regulator [Amycolatopsis methanolica group]AIJ20271.1 TetR family transcriptional regulator [Amycolatopsis methanolica 239]ROS40909.1 TetR family transcriptional regulator [Amycolatopsis thermoflava]
MATREDRRSGAETRAEILRVALRLFIEKGYEGTSTRDISTALGITKSALYYHFPSKEAIVTSLLTERRKELAELVEWIRAQPASPDLLRRAALRWIDGTTSERLDGMRLMHANGPVLRKLLDDGADVRSEFEQVVDLLVPGDATPADRLLVRMAFDTVGAALLAAQRTDASPEDVLAAARRATIALTG